MRCAACWYGGMPMSLIHSKAPVELPALDALDIGKEGSAVEIHAERRRLPCSIVDGIHKANYFAQFAGGSTNLCGLAFEVQTNALRRRFPPWRHR